MVVGTVVSQEEGPGFSGAYYMFPGTFVARYLCCPVVNKESLQRCLAPPINVF